MQTEEIEDCIADGLSHQFEFLTASDGLCLWRCKFCLKTKTEYEDGLTG